MSDERERLETMRSALLKATRELDSAALDIRRGRETGADYDLVVNWLNEALDAAHECADASYESRRAR